LVISPIKAKPLIPIMITKKRFLEIKDEVEVAVAELFDYAKDHNSDYILFLADAEYNDAYRGSRISPYVISYQVDYYKEETRLEFFQYFLNSLYTFGNGATQSTDSPFWQQLELMIYCQIWESNRYLKQLYRIQRLINGNLYTWQVNVIPDSSKHSFIRNTIRDGFKSKGLKIAEVITKGFHTSLRNSFLHSEFEIDDVNSKILLHTQREGNLQAHELPEISFNDWTERFIYSVFLNYFFLKEKEKRRKNVKKDFGTDEFLVAWPRLPRRAGVRIAIGILYIYYDESRDSFYPQRNEPYTGSRIAQAPPATSPSTTATVPIISAQELQAIEKRSGEAVKELLKALHNASEEKYIAWLFDVTFDKASGKYVSQTAEEKSRLQFSATLMDEVYIKASVQLPDLIRIQMEMMIYCHVWESRLFLRQLRSAARILSGDAVNWDEEPQSDRRLLVEDIVQKLRTSNCSIAELIDEGFHTSLRNAFAHSEFEIDPKKKEIYLDTYKPNEPWDIPSISFSDWKQKFLASLTLDFQLLMAKDDLRAKVEANDVQQVLDAMNNVPIKP